MLDAEPGIQVRRFTETKLSMNLFSLFLTFLLRVLFVPSAGVEQRDRQARLPSKRTLEHSELRRMDRRVISRPMDAANGRRAGQRRMTNRGLEWGDRRRAAVPQETFGVWKKARLEWESVPHLSPIPTQ